MPKIKEIVQIDSGYASYVDLYPEYYDIERNRGRMERYKPITAHRVVFEKVANALNPKDRRFYFLSGSYGTGKSHLLLMLANYFALPSDLPEIKSFFDNYAVAQKDVLLKPGETFNERKAASLKDARKSGLYLVAICRYDLNLDFEGILLRALQDALQREESTLIMDTHYQEAIRRIKDWESRRGKERFYKDFEDALTKHHSDWTIKSLLEDLQNYQEDALGVFKACFQLVTDSDFTYKKDNLRDILSDLLKHLGFKETYKGIVFIYDEFGSAIDKGLVDYGTMLAFSQFCAESTLEKGGTVIFIGSGHKTFLKHGQLGDLNAETLAARVTEIGLATQGMEDIISAIVHPLKDSSEWQQHIAANSGKFTWFSAECKSLNLFNWLPAPKIRKNIIQNIYPMHPLATYALLRLAGEAGSDNRSVFKFFSPEFETGETGWKNVQPFSFPWFLENHEIIQGGKLILYTADLLVDYFKEGLKSDNNRLMDSVKKAVVNYETTLRELNAYTARKNQDLLFDEADELMGRILKILLVNDIASTQDATIVNTIENIHFGLDAVDEGEKKQIDDRLKLLCDAAIIYKNDKNIYELIPGDRKDVRRMVDQYKANPDNKPTNLLHRFLDYIALKNDETFLEARDYNTQYNEDKRLLVKFATPSMLSKKQMVSGEELSFFTVLERESGEITEGSRSYEGTAVFAFCESDADINAAKKAITKNDQERVVVAVPRQPIIVSDALFTLEALNSELFKKQAEDFSPYEKAEEKKIRDEALGVLKAAKDNYFSNQKVNWFSIRGEEIPARENVRHDAANRIMQKLYTDKRNTFARADFNKTHVKISGQTMMYLKEAGDILCPLLSPIQVNWTWPDNRGSTRYLRKCFVDHQVLKIIHTEGDVRTLEAEKTVSKFSKTFPAYAFLLNELAQMEGKGPKSPMPLINQLREELGQGDMAITLMLLLARRFYGDSLRFKGEPSHLMDMQFEKTEDMLALVQGQFPSAVVLFEPVSEADQTYFQIVTQTFSDQPGQAGKTFTISEAYKALTTWWDNLPVIAHSTVFYGEEEKVLAELISQAKVKDTYLLIKIDLLEQLNITPGKLLSKDNLNHIQEILKKFKTFAEDIQQTFEKQILKEIAQLFQASSELDVDVQDALKTWFIGLSDSQKDTKGSYHNNDSKPLVRFTNYANIWELLFVTLPEAYGFGEVSDWTSNQVSEYIERIRRGKAHIETNAPQVGQLKLQYKHVVDQQGDQVTFRGKLEIDVDTEDGKGSIYYTDDGSDPITSKQRKELKPGDTLIIQGNNRVRMVVADGQGNYSAIKIIDAINDLEKYKIMRKKQTEAFDEVITFVFPKDQEAAQMTIATLMTSLRDAGIYKKDELEKAVNNALQENRQKGK